MKQRLTLPVVLYLVVGGFTLLPVLALFFYAFWQDGQFQGAVFWELVQTPRMTQLIWQSFQLGFWVVVGAFLCALPLAILTTRTSLRQHYWVDVVLTIPFMTPPYIGAMGWILFMQKNGLLLTWFPHLNDWSTHFFSFGGMVFIMAIHLFPFLYLMIKNALLQLEGSFQDAALIYGKNSLRNWLRITLPLLIPSFILGALLVFVKTLAEFGTPITFGTRIGYRVFTTEIHRNLSALPISVQQATMLAFLLFICCFIVWGLQTLIIQRFLYAPGKASSQMFRRSPKRLTQWLAWLYFSFLVVISIGIPYCTILLTSLMKIRGNGLKWSNLGLDAYKALFFGNQGGLSAFWNSLEFALIAATATTVIGFFAAIFIGKSQQKSQKMLDFMIFLPNIVPGIVLVVGLMLFWNNAWMPVSIYNTRTMVIVTYVALFLPYSVQYIKNSRLQLDESLLASGAIFQKNGLHLVLNLYLPLLKRGILTGWMMTFVIAMRELVGALLILPPGIETSATFIYKQFEQGNVNVGMAMAVITILLTIACVAFIERLKSQKGSEPL